MRYSSKPCNRQTKKRKKSAAALRAVAFLLGVALTGAQSSAEPTTPHRQRERLLVQIARNQYEIDRVRKSEAYNLTLRLCRPGGRPARIYLALESAIQLLDIEGWGQLPDHRFLSPTLHALINSEGFAVALRKCFGEDPVSHSVFIGSLVTNDFLVKLVTIYAGMRGLGKLSTFLLRRAPTLFKALAGTSALYFLWSSKKQLRTYFEEENINSNTGSSPETEILVAQIEQETIELERVAKTLLSTRLRELETERVSAMNSGERNRAEELAAKIEALHVALLDIETP